MFITDFTCGNSLNGTVVVEVVVPNQSQQPKFVFPASSCTPKAAARGNTIIILLASAACKYPAFTANVSKNILIGCRNRKCFT